MPVLNYAKITVSICQSSYFTKLYFYILFIRHIISSFPNKKALTQKPIEKANSEAAPSANSI